MHSAPSSMTRIAPLSPLCRKSSASSDRPSRQSGDALDEIHRRSGPWQRDSGEKEGRGHSPGMKRLLLSSAFFNSRK